MNLKVLMWDEIHTHILLYLWLNSSCVDFGIEMSSKAYFPTSPPTGDNIAKLAAAPKTCSSLRFLFIPRKKVNHCFGV
jgi:hypothetical protein